LQHGVDAIFLDINIPSLDGVLLAQNINQLLTNRSLCLLLHGRAPLRAIRPKHLTTFLSLTSHASVACCKKAGSGLATGWYSNRQR
jgi:CheY-like chemotaxis protein